MRIQSGGLAKKCRSVLPPKIGVNETTKRALAGSAADKST